jgi:NAD(P)H dehydrogenase (quinone)
MRVLVIYCHPNPESFTAAIRETALASLAAKGHETRLIDLYAMDFNPVLGREERARYHTPVENERDIAEHLEALRWAQGLLFVYPTWWYGLPAMLKGWLDRVWVPHATFDMPKGRKPISRVMTNITHIAAISTLGAPRFWWWMIGAPGRRTLLTGIGVICNAKCRTKWIALHRIDVVGADKRIGFLNKIHIKLSRFF